MESKAKRRAVTKLLSTTLLFLLTVCGLAFLLLVTLAILVLKPFSQAESVQRADADLATSALRDAADLKTPEELYLELMKRVLTRYELSNPYVRLKPRSQLNKFIYSDAGVKKALASRNLEIVRVVPFAPRERAEGRDWPSEAETMTGLKRLNNLQFCVTDVLRRNVPGDLIECGAWRGGSCIFMRSVLKAYADSERTVWVADSFEGLPKPDPEQYPADTNDLHWTFDELSISLEEVKENFSRYGLLDDQVRFLKGWFKDTLPSAPIEKLAILRIDADMYGSTMEALRYLYPNSLWEDT